MNRAVLMIPAVLAVEVLIADLSYSLGGWAYQSCSIDTVVSKWSGDGVYRADLQKKKCIGNADVRYSARIESFRENKDGKWYVNMNIENDQIPKITPSISWISSGAIKILSYTETLSGEINYHISEYLSVKNIYQPDKNRLENLPIKKFYNIF